MQRLADALRPGETGCLRRGDFDGNGQYVLRIAHGGQSGAPITIRSYRGERATLRGTVYVVNGSNFVRLLNLDVVGSQGDNAVKVYSTDVVISGDDITNRDQDESCVILGSNLGWGQAQRTLIVGNRIHDCGTTNLDHGIYVDNSEGATIGRNLIWNVAGFGVHLYPNAQMTLIEHNVIVATGRGGVIFAGNTETTSNGNVFIRNIVSDSQGSGVRGYWGGAVGSNNVAARNCIWKTAQPVGDQGGFVASGTVTADPRFRDARHHDFRLQLASPCLRVVGYDTAASIVR